MKIYTLKRSQWIPQPLAEVFAFFEKPENLAIITPPSLAFRILTPSPIRMAQGTRIEYTIRVLGLPIHWTTEITAYAPPHRFIDSQIRGPYQQWIHTHVFTESNGRTLMEDTVDYAIGWGPVGSIAHALYVRRQLQHIFDYRRQVIEERMGK